jgi:hypothetical protein
MMGCAPNMALLLEVYEERRLVLPWGFRCVVL